VDPKEHLIRESLDEEDGSHSLAPSERPILTPSQAEYLIKLLFAKNNCLCHDINQTSKTASHVDVILGFATGDLVWFEPFSQRYSRINKKGAVNKTPVLAVRWLPGSDSQFMAAHRDGFVGVYEKDRDDDGPVDDAAEADEGRAAAATPLGPDGAWDLNKSLHVVKSAESRNQKANPVALWHVSRHAVNAIAFAPDGRHVAFACQNNSWRIVDYVREE
jgi:hypothetical protein